jgi:DNA-binding transcriptional LysR family regulator
MDLRRLRLFVAVAEQGGFTAAAEAEHVAQPAVSLAIRELEQELGAPLFIRSRSGATLTAAGEALLGPARQALRDVEHAIAAVAAVTGLVAGHLDLACLPTLAADPVAELVGRFRREHPGVTVRMGAPLDLEELANAVRTGAAEVGITEQGPANAGLEEIRIGEQELFAVAPTGGPTSPLRLERLEGVPLVLSPTGSSLRDAVDLALAEAGVRPDIGVETAQRDALIPLVLAGAGTTLLPDTLARAAGRLGATVRPTRPRLRRTIALVHRPGDPGPAATRFLALA